MSKLEETTQEIKLHERSIFGQKVWSSSNRVVTTDKGEKGVGKFVSDSPSGKRGEWIAYHKDGSMLEGRVVGWS